MQAECNVRPHIGRCGVINNNNKIQIIKKFEKNIKIG